MKDAYNLLEVSIFRLNSLTKLLNGMDARLKTTYIGLGIVFLVMACAENKEPTVNPYEDVREYLTTIEATTQRSGDAAQGKNYLLYGDYVDSGVPAGMYGTTFGLMTSSENLLERTGPSTDINYSFNLTKAPNGEDIVAPNCMQCHSGKVDGEFVFGLGNIDFDATINQGEAAPFLDLLVKSTYGESSPEYDAFRPFNEAIVATAGQLVTDVIGANSADKLAAVLAAHRTQDDLVWSNEPLIPIPDEVIPADVPAWWLLKKKHAMFTTAVGRKDFSRLMMASSILTMQDSTKAREVDNRFPDVLAYINTLEPPAYAGQIDDVLTERGREIFLETCSKCHGTYGPQGSYPNVLVSHEILETDRNLAESNFAYDYFVDWYNNSWFAQGPHAAVLMPGDGYVAPPLDGVWATAPYLHNGSVPTLMDLLDSSRRPEVWRRVLSDKNYDHDLMGIAYKVKESKSDKYDYDTSIRGYGNEGHYFADHLDDGERTALLEYLKTL